MRPALYRQHEHLVPAGRATRLPPEDAVRAESHARQRQQKLISEHAVSSAVLHHGHHRQRQREHDDQQHLQRNLQPQNRPDAQLFGQQVPDVLRERYAERALVPLSREGLLEYLPVRGVHDSSLKLGPLVEPRELGEP